MKASRTMKAKRPGGTVKGFVSGTHRVVPPERTLAAVSQHFARLQITRVADITGLDRIGVPVAAAYRPTSRSLVVSMGKGRTKAAAMVAAAMESLELWHAERVTLQQYWGRAADLSTRYRMTDWKLLPPASDTPLDPTIETAWVMGSSLLDDEPLLVPFEAVHTDGRLSEPVGSGWFACSSNGLASGNHVLEALVHALCEVIERDAVTLWRIASPTPESTRIEHASITDPGCLELLDRFESAGIEVILDDATSDVPLPVIHCTAFEREGDPRAALYTSTGMGCHPDRNIALSRALTEAAQSRLALISGARDDVFRHQYVQVCEANYHLHTLASRLSEPAGRRFVDLPTWENDTFEDDLDLIVSLLSAAAMSPVWLSLTRRDIGVPVVRVLVPGLETLSDLSTYRPGARALDVVERRVPSDR
jgi:YcaO-like protein with predicted kinase domain